MQSAEVPQGVALGLHCCSCERADETRFYIYENIKNAQYLQSWFLFKDASPRSKHVHTYTRVQSDLQRVSL